jgi:hypothetical protein
MLKISFNLIWITRSPYFKMNPTSRQREAEIIDVPLRDEEDSGHILAGF